MTESQDRQYEMHHELIERCKQHDPRAQCKVYELYYKAMYNACLRIIQDVTTAEDVMQEAFLTAFEKIGSFKGESAFGAWLKKIVINKSLDELKKNRPFFDPLENSSEALRLQDDDSFSEEEEMELNKKITRIKQTIALLPDGYRIILSLYLFEGYDHEEISEILQISESTSRSQFSRAKHKLLELLKMTS
jgi:RNA polymerase sigma-70 factor (ECF subfamily)